jgi:hypothetical protein
MSKRQKMEASEAITSCTTSERCILCSSSISGDHCSRCRLPTAWNGAYLQLAKPLWSTIFSYLHLASSNYSYRNAPASDLPALRLTCCTLAALVVEKSHELQSELVLEAWASQEKVQALVNAAPLVRVVTLCLHDRNAIEGRMGAETYMMGTIQLMLRVTDLLVSGRDVQRCTTISSPSFPSIHSPLYHLFLDQLLPYRILSRS